MITAAPQLAAQVAVWLAPAARAAFEELVAKHEIHYYVGQGSESFGGGRVSSSIASWVAAHFKKETVGGQTV